jgi:hypothetical protein
VPHVRGQIAHNAFMPTRFKVSDVGRTASLLKKLVEKSDVNQDGAVRWREARWGVDPKNGRGITSKKNPRDYFTTAQAIESAMRFSQSKGSSEIGAIKKSIDEIARRVKAADQDGDGIINDSEHRKLKTGAENTFVRFGQEYAGDKLADFNLPATHQAKLPSFSWKGTPKQVCTSLLNAYSERKNDNFWSNLGPSRFVLTQTEAKKMVDALKPLYPSRQKAVLTELAARTLKSEFGCVSCNAGARSVFEKLARDLGVSGLQFRSPAAPKQPAP